MAKENFYMKKTDAYLVKIGLDVNKIKQEQNSTDFVFEVHDGHLTGNPIYIRPEACANDNSNLPKFDTKNKSSANYKKIKDFANHEKLTKNLKNKQQTELLELVKENWEAFETIAQSFSGDNTTQNQTAESLHYCSTCKKNVEESTLKESNEGKKCPTCYKVLIHASKKRNSPQ